MKSWVTGVALVALSVQANAPSEPPPMSDAQAQAALELNCQSCHSLAYVGQQRLTAAQWSATLTKMRGWGAMLEEAEVAPLALALAARRGPDAGVPVFEAVQVKPFVPVVPSRSPTAVARGKETFTTRCIACHGPDAHGGIGVNLVDRALLQEPAAFTTFVRRGRARMPPHPDLSEGQLDAVRAYLGTLR